MILCPGTHYWVLVVFSILTTLYHFPVLGVGNPFTVYSQCNTAVLLRKSFCLDLSDNILEQERHLLVSRWAPVVLLITCMPKGLVAPWKSSAPEIPSYCAIPGCYLASYHPPTPFGLVHSIKLKFRLWWQGGVTKEKGKPHVKWTFIANASLVRASCS